MKINYLSYAIASSLALISLQSAASDSTTSAIEVITVKAPKLTHSETTLAEGNLVMPDVADWLQTVPGANINKNGPVTGIAQYRGMFGDRIAKSISGHQIISAGPNAMDAPLTYINPMMVDSVVVYRGIAPASSGIDTIGGAIEVNLKQATTSDKLAFSGDLSTSFNDFNNASTLAGNINIATKNIGLLAYTSDQQGDDYQDANGKTVKSTRYDKQQHGLDLRYDNDRLMLGTSWHKSQTADSGTPALPMDIDYIDSQRFNTDGSWQSDNDTIDTIEWQLGYQDATHGMDNFSQRKNMMDSMHRYNTATATTFDYKVKLTRDQWQLGLEGFDSKHDSTITNPTNDMFKIDNFNQVKDARHSIFVQWAPTYDQHSHTLGLRIKQNIANAGTVKSSMAMSNANIKALQDAFNGADRSINKLTYDLTLNNQYEVSSLLSFNYALAIKQRAPSYQERYLWLPMQATGGLADGKTYVGNINLAPETAHQVDLGLSYDTPKFSIAPHIYYQQVSDYIQGTPATDMAVKMVATMMGDPTPLQFNNIDATLYGADINWHYQLTDNVKLSGIASYVRGKRDDINDNLYRIMPLNARVNLHYQQDNWQTNLSLHAYNKQTDVSKLNDEKVSAGYTVVDWQVDYFVMPNLVVRAGINNLLNKQYSAHLAGINRAQGSELNVGQGITASERNIVVALDYQF